MRLVTPLVAAALTLAGVSGAMADKIKNPTAAFSGLDKITGRIINFDVAVDETVQFGALQITPRVCYSRPPTESQSTNAFIEVDEVTLDNNYRRIFSGWMFQASPGLHGVEHAVYDVWLTECRGGTNVIAEPQETEEAPVVATRGRGRRGGGAGGGAGEGSTREASRPRPQRTNAQGQLDVEAPRGVPVQPSQQPSRRFFPTNAPAAPTASRPMPGYGGFDPAGGNR